MSARLVRHRKIVNDKNSFRRHGCSQVKFFSHGNLNIHRQNCKVREAVNSCKRIAILVDTRGPEVRIKTFAEGEIELQEGEKFTLTTEDIEGDSRKVSINYRNLPGDVPETEY